MFKLVAALAVLAAVYAQSNDNVITCRENGVDGECVSYYLCDDSNRIITDGDGLLDIRVNDNAPCPSYMQRCCQNKRDTPIVPEINTQREGCGWRNPQGVGMRTTGDVNGEAKFGEFPWIVVLLQFNPQSRKTVYKGVGSLIHPSVVLTTAHLVANSTDKTTLLVRAGEWDTQINTEIYPHQDRKVDRLILHKDYNAGTMFYDIALLFLKKPMDLAPNVGIACLPPPKQNQAYIPPSAGTKCLVAGWGKDKFGQAGHYQVILKKLEVPVVTHYDCQTALRRTRLGNIFQLHTSFMCAGGEPGVDTCKGDGGSPLVCPIEYEDGRYVQNGIVSWGIGCGANGTPGVYVDVASLRNWIDDKVASQGYKNESIFYHFSYAYTPNA